MINSESTAQVVLETEQHLLLADLTSVEDQEARVHMILHEEKEAFDSLMRTAHQAALQVLASDDTAAEVTHEIEQSVFRIALSNSSLVEEEIEVERLARRHALDRLATDIYSWKQLLQDYTPNPNSENNGFHRYNSSPFAAAFELLDPIAKQLLKCTIADGMPIPRAAAAVGINESKAREAVFIAQNNLQESLALTSPENPH